MRKLQRKETYLLLISPVEIHLFQGIGLWLHESQAVAEYVWLETLRDHADIVDTAYHLHSVIRFS
jgi:hypothetical protein